MQWYQVIEKETTFCFGFEEALGFGLMFKPGTR
jgi:hypothetical protein